MLSSLGLRNTHHKREGKGAGGRQPELKKAKADSSSVNGADTKASDPCASAASSMTELPPSSVSDGAASASEIAPAAVSDQPSLPSSVPTEPTDPSKASSPGGACSRLQDLKNIHVETPLRPEEKRVGVEEMTHKMMI